MHRYGAFRLMSNLVYTHPKEIKPFAEAELPVATALILPLCLNLLQEIEFMEEEQ